MNLIDNPRYDNCITSIRVLHATCLRLSYLDYIFRNCMLYTYKHTWIHDIDYKTVNNYSTCIFNQRKLHTFSVWHIFKF